MEKSLLEIYREKVEDLERAEIIKLQQKIRDEVLIDLIEKKVKPYLSLWVVLVESSDIGATKTMPDFLYFICDLGVSFPCAIFYKDKNFYVGNFRIAECNKYLSIFTVREISSVQTRWEIIIDALDTILSKKQSFNPYVPLGYFLLKLNADRIFVGSGQTEPVQEMEAIMDYSFESAANKFLRSTDLGNKGNLELFVCFAGSNGWKEITPYGKPLFRFFEQDIGTNIKFKFVE